MDRDKPPAPESRVSGDKPLRWYQGLDRYCWVVMAVSALGWLFDTMDQNIYNLVRKPSLTELLHPHPERPDLTDQEKKALGEEVKSRGGDVTMIFILGWATGGFVFGMLGDRLGRTRTMVITILTYAIFTGLSGLAQSWQFYAAARFVTGLGVGGEWAAGASLVAEVFPERARPMALGLLQALSAIGNMIASAITLILPILDLSWRWAYAVGAAPALLVFWILTKVREPERWREAKEQATVGRQLGNIFDLFRHPVIRHNTIAAVLMATAGVGALWGVGFFSPDFVDGRLEEARGVRAAEQELAALRAKGEPTGEAEGRIKAARSEIAQQKSAMFFIQNLGSFFGIYLFAAFSERFTRRRAFAIWFVLAWASILCFFWGIEAASSGIFLLSLALAFVMGFCTLGPFSGYTVYFPYLFPTRLRATGSGFCYNVARYLAAFAPAAMGKLSASMGSARAATIVSFVYILGFVGTWLGPETKGRPLPEDADFEAAPRPASTG